MCLGLRGGVPILTLKKRGAVSPTAGDGRGATGHKRAQNFARNGGSQSLKEKGRGGQVRRGNAAKIRREEGTPRCRGIYV